MQRSGQQLLAASFPACFGFHFFISSDKELYPAVLSTAIFIRVAVVWGSSPVPCRGDSPSANTFCCQVVHHGSRPSNGQILIVAFGTLAIGMPLYFDVCVGVIL